MRQGLKVAAGIGILSSVLLWGSMMTSMASGRISNVRVNIEYQDVEGELLEPAITAGSSNYDVSDITWDKNVDNWKPGKKVTATITLSSENGEFSGSYSKGNCTVSGGTFVSAKVSDGDLILKASYIPVVRLGQTEGAGWSDTNQTRATWKKVPYATAYQLKLYRNGEEIKTITLQGSSIDLSQYMTQEASYTYEVRATSQSSSESAYLKTGEYVHSQGTLLDNLGDTEGQWREYQEGSTYTDESGNSPVSEWKLIVGKWYYFNDQGYAVRGWNYINDKWYSMDEKGVMRIGWYNDNGKWYYLDNDGSMHTGWVQTSPGDWYYMNSDGSMAVNTTVEGCYVNETGKWIQ